MVQFYLFCTCVITEIFLLAVMAYDRFVAICNPLLYMVIMSQKLCAELVSGCYLLASVSALVHLCLTLEIPDYNFNEVITIIIILTSYLFILITILKMRSAEGRRKAFSTCASHLTAIVVFHETILFFYCQPSSGTSLDIDKVTTVFYTVVIPVLNSLIYCLGNKDVKEALRKALSSNTDF
ncbi:Olfactory receptor 5L1 [Sciurus carolinensis]|uniref:Olfactory receptor 5L1 n=1 Tax=Sciurus carolinensis TaxID=30640 RepID=A0AA41SZZ7_SCICA|nr:Olfactory receptor 5L1 [Sciurus carolinensis]